MIPLRTDVPVRRRPRVVWTLLAVNTLVFLWQTTLGPRQSFLLAVHWALVPRRYSDPAWALAVGLDPANQWPLLTNTFLHGGWLHLIANMWTLWLFGAAVEDRMGHLRFALFYVLCGVLASWAHMAAYPTSEVPALGASGAIAAVLGAHITLHPRSRVLLLVPILFIPLILPVTTWAYAAVWFGLQVLQGAGDLLMPEMGGGIAWWAHIGGFVAGLAVVRFLAPPDPPDPSARRP
ncbi:rhomboid family intramembrane serine protease [Rhodospirillum centenum]|uniref:Rhomboid family membrane protein n=1 Tax=Rhodospirillum centenum (strain ATCC 51521 / SW) TaxID=414684 RepID=B6IUS5_RHOCS|nr:rhomboid family intramembrane serine protease [Rhodospirillum centenum]ACJ00007.1 rhomboid family membrane protein [Rhodospirillum centenum SW]